MNKNIYKKIIAMLLILALVGGALVACEKTNTTDPSVSKSEPATTENEKPVASTSDSDGTESLTLIEELEKALYAQLDPMPTLHTGDKIGVLIYSLVNPFWANMKEKYELAGKELGLDVEVFAVSKADSTTEQLEIFDSMITKDFKAIIFSPMDTNNLIPGILRANEAGVPVINLGPGVNMEALEQAGGKLDARITVNFEQQGQMAVEDMAKKLEPGSKVAIIAGKPGAAQSEGRVKGATDAFKEAGMEIVNVLPGNWDRNTAYQLVTDLLLKEPDLKAIFSANDVMGLAAVEALEQANKKDGILVYGVDFTDEAKEAIQKGRYDGTITYSPSIYTKASEILTLKLLQGHDVSKPVMSPLVVVNQENITKFDDWR